MNIKPLILVVDDEQAILVTLKHALLDEGFDVVTLDDGAKTLDLIGQLIPDVVLLDIFMPGCNGLDLLRAIQSQYPQQNVIIMSGFGTIPIAIEAMRSGALDFIEKPLSLDELLVKLTKLIISTPADDQHNNSSQQELLSYGIVGASELFTEFMHQVAMIIPLQHPVLLYGPHGSGKSLIVRYIHKKMKTDKPLYIFDCAEPFAIDEAGVLSAGVLFIKNIQLLDHQQQKDVLALIRRYKDTVRIIASALPDLFQRFRQGTFSGPLFFELNVLPLEIIPLNKRRYDIPLLVHHFLAKANERYNKQVAISADGMRLLRDYDWKGNIQQLEWSVYTIVARVQSGILTSENLVSYLADYPTNFVSEQSFTRFSSLEEALNHFEQTFLHHLLKQHHFNLAQLSAHLNISQQQLEAKLTKFNLAL